MLILLTAVPSFAAGKSKLVVGGDHQNPPFEFLQQGAPTGFNVELMRAVSQKMGADVEIRLSPWAEARTALEEGKIDALAGMYYSEKRSRLVDFSLPHTMVTMGLYVRTDSTIQSIEDIRGKEVIVQRGDIVDDFLRENKITPHIIQVTDPADELRLLASGRHDCALMPSRLQSEYLIRTLGLSNIMGVGKNLPQWRYCFAVPKGHSALRYRLDEALDILKVNGEYKKIYDKWFGIYEKRDLWQTIKYYVWAMALIVLLLGASFIWSWSLRRQVRKRTAELRESEGALQRSHNELERRVEYRTAELADTVDALQNEIAERHKAEKALQDLNRTLEERIRREVAKNREKDVMLIQQNRQAALGEILDHIAHQWKHPLSTISLTAYLLNTDNALNENSVREATGSIIEQVKDLTQMLNDYRDFYRPDKEKSVFRIEEGIDRALSFITPVLCIESIKLEVNTAADLYALGYPKAFAQVILNLVSNSRDAFMEREVKNPRIVVNGFAENEMAVVTVTDNAGGINAADMASIFEMNFTTKDQSGGTGIGLYMSRNIIERNMGGDLAAANVEDGAQFCIRLPIAESAGRPAT